MTATDGKTGNERPISYTNCKVVGNGSFGVVFAAKMLGKVLLLTSRTRLTGSGTEGRWIRRARTGYCNQEGPTGQAVQGEYSLAVRIGLIVEPRIANHEIGFSPKCRRPQGLFLHKRREGTFTGFHGGMLLTIQKDEVYLNLVLEFVPETVYRASRHYSKLKQVMPMLQVKLYMYQVSTLCLVT